MRRLTERARVVAVLGVVFASCIALAGCDQLEARNNNGKGNRFFRDTAFTDAAAHYERALKILDDPTIHFNLGLAYSKIFKPGFDGPVLLAPQNDPVCRDIPGTRPAEAGACIKEGDRHHAECGKVKSAPVEKAISEFSAQISAETDEAKKKELEGQRKDKQEELSRFTCPSSYQCYEGAFCSLTSPELADIAAKHLETWIKAQPSDEQLKKELVEANKELDKAKQAQNQSLISTIQHRIDELSTKELMRVTMTRLWMDSEQYDKALGYWYGLLKERPTDTAIIGTIAGIENQAGHWRKAIDLYNQVADLVPDAGSKVAEYQNIGYLAWQKLNQKQFPGGDAVELADRAIAALQKASEVQPKNTQVVSLQGSIFNFRSTIHGASWAAAIDRASAQDLAALRRVLADQAKNAQGQGQPAPDAPAAGGSGTGSGSAGAGSESTTPAAGAGTPAPAAPGGTGSAAGAPAPGSGPPPSAAPTTAPPGPPAASGGKAEKSGG